MKFGSISNSTSTQSGVLRLPTRATRRKLLYETFSESRKLANRLKSGGIIHEFLPSRSEAREDISSLLSACDKGALCESQLARPVSLSPRLMHTSYETYNSYIFIL